MSSSYIADPNELLPPPVVRWVTVGDDTRGRVVKAFYVGLVKMFHQKARRLHNLGSIDLSTRRWSSPGIEIAYWRSSGAEYITVSITPEGEVAALRKASYAIRALNRPDFPATANLIVEVVGISEDEDPRTYAIELQEQYGFFNDDGELVTFGDPVVMIGAGPSSENPARAAAYTLRLYVDFYDYPTTSDVTQIGPPLYGEWVHDAIEQESGYWVRHDPTFQADYYTYDSFPSTLVGKHPVWEAWNSGANQPWLVADGVRSELTFGRPTEEDPNPLPYASASILDAANVPAIIDVRPEYSQEEFVIDFWSGGLAVPVLNVVTYEENVTTSTTRNNEIIWGADSAAEYRVTFEYPEAVDVELLLTFQTGTALDDLRAQVPDQLYDDDLEAYYTQARAVFDTQGFVVIASERVPVNPPFNILPDGEVFYTDQDFLPDWLNDYQVSFLYYEFRDDFWAYLDVAVTADAPPSIIRVYAPGEYPSPDSNLGSS